MRLLKIIRNIFIILLLVGSLAFNGAIFALEIAGMSFAAFWDAATMATEVTLLKGANKNLTAKNGRLGVVNSTLKSENSKLKKSHARLTKTNKGLITKSGKLATKNKDLVTQASLLAANINNLTNANSKLKGEKKQLNSALTQSKDNWKKGQTNIDTLTKSVNKRLVTTTASNIGAMAGEAIPVIGWGVIIAATTYEVTQACKMATEMVEIRKTMEIEGGDDEKKVCGMKVPDHKELLAKVEMPDWWSYKWPDWWPFGGDADEAIEEEILKKQRETEQALEAADDF